jgi:hypothetical protein
LLGTKSNTGIGILTTGCRIQSAFIERCIKKGVNIAFRVDVKA